MTDTPRPLDRLTADRWAAIKSIFDRIVDAPESERQTILDELTAGDGHLRADVVALIDADTRSDALPDVVPTPCLLLDDPLVGRTIGAYRIERELGHGGMGTVYAARRTGAFEQTVAIKVMRRGFDAARILERFLAERQILAKLEHPNIGRLFDGGSTPEGLPYFVMELLQGDPITTHCRARAVARRDRLRLFLDACDAVDYAHRQLVVHRDLKPGNVLVTRDGVVKLLDFGIASVIDAGDPAGDATVLLSADYASPEARRGEGGTIASDVYSLGVLLRELLTDARPDEALPGQPMPADLDAIVRRATAADPAARYASVRDLTEDVRRYLAYLPVTARRGSVGYRAARFLRRHRVPAAAAFMVVASLSAGLVMTARSARIANEERVRAELRFEDVRRLTHTLLFDLHDEVGRLPGAIEVRQRLLARAQDYLDTLGADPAAASSLRMEAAIVYDRIGALAFDMETALANYTRAAAIFDELSSGRPTDATLQHRRIENLHNIGDLRKMMGQTDRALADAARALEMSRALAQAFPDSPDALEMIRRSHSLIGFIHEDAGEFEAAVPAYASALAVSEEAYRRWPDNAGRRRVGMSLTRLGVTLDGSGQPREAMLAFDRAAALLEPLALEEPVNVVYKRDVWLLLLRRGEARLARGDGNALDELLRALQIKEWLAESDPSDTGHQRGLSVTRFAVGRALERLGRKEEAARYYEGAVALGDRLTAIDANNLESRIDVGEFSLALARLLPELGRAAQAGIHRAEGVATLRACAARSPRNKRVQHLLDSAGS